MKCKECNGVGYVKTISVGGVPCSTCNGTCEIELTNEEWLRQASTEELADVLTEIACESYYDGLDEKLPLKHNCKHFMKWLKEKHDESV